MTRCPHCQGELSASPTSEPTYGLTARQREALAYIEDYISALGVSPSFSDIATGTGLSSKSGVARIVDALVERGYITRLPYRTRSISLIEARP